MRIRKDTTATLDFPISDQVGAPVVLTGGTASLVLARRLNAVEADWLLNAPLAIVAGGSNNLARLTVTPATLDAVPNGDYWGELRAVLADGSVVMPPPFVVSVVAGVRG